MRIVTYDSDPFMGNARQRLLRFFPLVALIHRLKPASVFAYSLRTSLVASLAARFSRVSDVYCLVNGVARTGNKTVASRRTSRLKIASYGVIGGLSQLVICQNADDLQELRKSRIFRRMTETHLTHGVGVDLKHFSMMPVSLEPTTFLCLASSTSLEEVRAFATAAMALKCQFPQVRFQLAAIADRSLEGGSLEDFSFEKEQRALWGKKGVEILDACDPLPWIKQASVVIFPGSSRKAGRIALEAMGCGRALIACDDLAEPGPLVNGINGLVVRARDAEDLAHAVRELLRYPQRICSMGRMSRYIAEAKYDLAQVNNAMLAAMLDLKRGELTRPSAYS